MIKPDMKATVNPKVWLITGCSSGFGREFVLAAFTRGDTVMATARDASKLEELKDRGVYTLLLLDIRATDDELRAQIDRVLRDVGGRIDILVNNAGYVPEGRVEECSDAEVRGLFDTNVFGVLSMLQVVLPLMHDASKFATAAPSMTLKAEVAHLGIDVVCLEPGNFLTNVLGDNTTTPSEGIDELQPAVQPSREHHEGISGQQPGDPPTVARIVREMLTQSVRFAGIKALPTWFPLGLDAVQSIRETMQSSSKELDEWQLLSASTGFDGP